MNATRVQHFLDTYHQLDIQHLDLLANIYHTDIDFVDPFHHVQSLSKLHEYFAGMYANVHYCRFDFEAPRTCGDEAFLRWRMRFAHPRLRGGSEILVPGISHIRFADGEDRVIFHEDFYDGGALLYEHVPLLGSAVRLLKNRMST